MSVDRVLPEGCQFTQQSQLDNRQLTDVKRLSKHCHRYDKYLPEMHWMLLSSASKFPGTFLIYHQKKLTAFLRIFFFFTGEVEIVLLVDPKSRRQGLARHLVFQAQQVLQSENIKALRFSLKDKQQHWLSQHQANYRYTDFFLRHALKKIKPARHEMSFANEKHINDILLLDKLCFKESNLGEAHLKELLTGNAYDICIITLEDKVIAKLHLHYGDKTSVIYDVATHPEHRGQGYAGALLSHALKLSKRKKMTEVTLDVTSTNLDALTVYQNVGFEMYEQKHYWGIALKDALTI